MRRHSRGKQLAASPYNWPHDASLSPKTTALVIIDMQRDFCEEGGYFDCQGYNIRATQDIIPFVWIVLDHVRTYAEYPVFFTREGHSPDLSTLSSREKFRSRNNPRHLGIGDTGPLGRFLIRGEPGHDIVPDLKPIPGEVVIDKPGRGAFAHTDFEHHLRLRGIKNLILVGVTTDVCVSTTMREANDRGFDCLVLEDATAAATPELHRYALESIKMEGGIFGAVAKCTSLFHPF
ncbi:isochorismatase [Exophiala viscosa]|uniref:Isochorismatase n=1 Tax=Exophiala viscosa TaxID=2486360 RepID=A0AAN6DMQ2_9EURO|nr:isochorismatase [Exophiala viscosa]KAI1625320.1 isochorismatase [Exophiala viscosa]